MSDYDEVRGRESVTSASRALNALRSWVLAKSRRPEKADLDEVVRALRSGPTDFRQSLSPSSDTDIPPSSRVFDALLFALMHKFGDEPSDVALAAWDKFLSEVVESHEQDRKTSLSYAEAGIVTELIELWLNALLQRPQRQRPEMQVTPKG